MEKKEISEEEYRKLEERLDRVMDALNNELDGLTDESGFAMMVIQAIYDGFDDKDKQNLLELLKE